ncbi:translation initiation factor eIF-2B subunit epsilon [Drepanopeziza brunnea f. sp. 'multigermtubi' MB_m1]|uniref:Mannose-1-phosphate guanyltransferase n=1 Tax=Marssonina brunnea f. sp. multigermtubi (strain MB_m1) TaxID=1072389 RepID=K1X2T5_MARBU|nr:translation initiation factor eIF-2B subunit epsilon [Drepanopeziza brunnea f. sp. 'multigermtubi' MB_m1]EKD15058.1 translation initiation factor eIF-2B subunit epsilon [Drepanopeziza brunnea f. sp. 'multigermtubi' MB_m1]
MAQAQKSAKGAGGGGGRAAKGGKKAAPGKKVEDERDETLQAVVLADSFETRFSPFTLQTPRCLLPLANTPLIEYTLEFLAMSGVADIYIYCGAHTADVERYIQASKWHPDCPASPFAKLEIVRTTARSVGDAMRDLDSRDLITGDFLLVHGDLVSNLPIDAALAAHRARRLADKNAIMTMVLRAGGLETHRTKSKGITPVFVVDPTKSRCLHYEEINPLQANRYVNLDPELISAHTELEIRTDLIDCGIDICTPDVLALWAESFDYEVPRRHFLHGVLKDYELNGKTIHTEVVDDHYAARVFNLQSYEAVSKDILGRWTYPLVPDSNLLAGQSYKFERGGLCKENGVILARTCKVGKRTVVGKDTSIGDGSVVSNSIIGRRCKIGKNVTIQNAYIWDDVAVGDGSVVDRAIIASEAVVGKNCKIQPGALLSYGVRIADGKEVKEASRITRAKRRQGDDDSDSDSLSAAVIPSDLSIVGEGGSGYLFEDSDEDEDEATIFHSNLIYSTSHLNISSESISTITSEPSISPPDEGRSRHSSFAGSISEDGEPGSSSNENFHHDAVAGLLDALKEGGDFGAARLEFMGLRLGNDATDHQMRRAIAVAFTKRITQLIETSKIEASKAAGIAFSSPGAESFLKEVAVGTDRLEEDQVDFIGCLQKDLVHRSNGAVILAAVSQKLYQLEVLEEEAFLAWWKASENLGDKEDGEMRRVREKTGVFVQWLKEAEVEEESSEEEGSEEESE